MPHHRWLNRIEYVTLAASVAGVITTALTQQLLFALTPVLFTLGISAAQRRQLQDHYNQLLAQVETMLNEPPDPDLVSLADEDLPKLIEQVQAIDGELGRQRSRLNVVAKHEEQLAQLTAKLEPLDQLVTTTKTLQIEWAKLDAYNLPEGFTHLQDSVRVLQDLIKTLQQVKTAPPATEFALDDSAASELNAKVSQLQNRLTADIEALDQQVQALKSDRPLPDQDMTDWQRQLQNLQAQIAALNPLANITQPHGRHPSPGATTVKRNAESTETATVASSESVATITTPPEPPPPVQNPSPWAEPTLDTSDSPASPLPTPDVAESKAPPTVPPQYRKESLTPEPFESEPQPASPAEDANSPDAETEDVDESESAESESDTALPPELEAGVRELGENLWAVGQSLRQTWERLAEGLDGEGKNTQAAWQLQQSYALQGFSPQAIAFSQAGQYVAYVTPQGEVQIVDWQQQTLEGTVRPDSSGVTALAFSPDAQLLLVGQTNGKSTLWYWSSGELHQTLSGHPLPITTVAFSPHGKTCATGSVDKTIALWDVGSAQLLRSLQGHWDRVTDLAFSPNGQSLISSSQDGTVKRWDIPTGEKVANAVPGGNVGCVAVSSDGEWVVSGSDRRVDCWTMNTLAQMSQQRVSKPITTIATATQHNTFGAIAGSQILLGNPTANIKPITIPVNTPAIALNWLLQDQALLCITETGQLQLWQLP